MAEQTDQDLANQIGQMKKISKFGKFVKDNAIAKVGVMKAEEPTEELAAESVAVPLPEETPETEYNFDADDYMRRALEDL